MNDRFAGMAGALLDRPHMAEYEDAARAGAILAHLVQTRFHVLEEANARLQGVPPDLPPHLGGQITPFLWTTLTAGLRQENDNLLATFLEQLITPGAGQPVAHLTTMQQYSNRLLQRTLSSTNISPGSSWLIDELLATLLRLLVPKTSEPQLEEARTPQTVDILCIFVGDRTLDVTPQQMLDYFWTDKLDTACLVCGETFEDERGPPIRTFSRAAEISAVSTKRDTRCCIRVFNRHFECLKRQDTRFVPVSYVWHRPVSEAHHLGYSSKEAERAVLDTLVQLLGASHIAYEDDTEFWHDYLSVPQWAHKAQQSLLFILPSIYHSAREILVCMEDVHGRHISQVLRLKSKLGQTLSLVDCLDAIPALHAFFDCRWFQRMWVSVEYACSHKASLMDDDHRIWRTRSLADPGPTDFLSQFSKDAHDLLNGVFNGVFIQASAFARSIFIGMPYFSRQVESPCLGEIASMIGGKECYYHRDRFIAVHVVLNQFTPAAQLQKQPSLPDDPIASCHQVWLHALERGDYSPLLLRPLPGKENGTAQARWLVGHDQLCRQAWELGNMVSRPNESHIVKEGLVEPTMEVVGVVTNICLIDFLDQDRGGVMEEILSQFQTTCTGGISNFASAITRLFPVDNNHKRAATILRRLPPIPYDEHNRADPTFSTRLQAAIDERSGSQIISILKLDHELIGIGSEATRLSRARFSSKRFHAQTGLNQHICTVHCNNCGEQHLFRMELRQTARVGATVYRIPGLSYSETVENGVGLVVQNQQVVGRMLYGAPACECHINERVKLV